MGVPTGNGLGWSVELCGGTHVKRTGDIGLISVVGEGGVSSGVRRLEAITGKVARHRGNDHVRIVESAATLLRGLPQEVLDRVETLQDSLKKAERALSEANKKLALGGGQSAGVAASTDEAINGVTYIGRAVEGIAARDIKGLVDTEKKRIGSGVVTLVLKGEDGR